MSKSQISTHIIIVGSICSRRSFKIAISVSEKKANRMARFWDGINWHRFPASVQLPSFTPSENLALENEYLCHARELRKPFFSFFFLMRMNKERAGICSVLMNPKPNMTSLDLFMHFSWKRPFWYIPLELKMPIFQFQRSSSLLSILYDLAFVCCPLMLPDYASYIPLTVYCFSG